MSASPSDTGSAPPSPIAMSAILGRRIRQDGLETLGTSTQTLAEEALRAAHWDLAAELTEYFASEIRIMNDVLFVWLADILDDRIGYAAPVEQGTGTTLLAGFRAFEPGRGDLDRALRCIEAHQAADAVAAIELMRVRWAAQHDGLVVWVQELLADIARSFGEDAVRASVTHAYEHIWKPRYVLWGQMTPEERLQLSVEGMRGGHLSGPRHRGDVGVTDEGDRYVMSLDPCGSCGILRRGDPDSGRPAQHPAGNSEPHPWTWGRTGMSWYSVHSPIALEYIQMAQGLPPLRPLEDCDLPDRPCRWFIYKDLAAARSIHYER
ncbi:MAG: hypothetical protein LH650_01230, partial [Chloroflexi bacterium]|nr:hypothetical protein [Chloroflexota bacterium]